MRRTLSKAGRAGLILLLMGATAAAGQPESLPVVTILVDNAKIIRLPERTSTVIVGNPIIAEVTPQKNGVLVLTGKSFGSTNLIALDNAGTARPRPGVFLVHAELPAGGAAGRLGEVFR